MLFYNFVPSIFIHHQGRIDGQRIATQTLGTLADILKPAAGTLWGIPYNQLPPLVAFSLLLAMLLTTIPARRKFVMPGFTRNPNVILSAAKDLTFNKNLSKGAVVALVLIVAQIATPTLAHAGDTGTPIYSPSSTNYLVYYHSDHLGSSHLITEGNIKGLHAGITYLKGDVMQPRVYAFRPKICTTSPENRTL